VAVTHAKIGGLLRNVGLLAAVTVLSSGIALGQTIYTWTGGIDSDWGTSSNWSGGSVAPTNSTVGDRINVTGGQPLVYTSALGTTTYNPAGTASPTFGRGLVMSGTSSFEVQSGSFTSDGGQSTIIALNAGTSTLTVSGGSFTSGNLWVGWNGGGGNGVVDVTGGTLTAALVTLGGSGSETGRINLSGGTLAVNNITSVTGTGTTRVLLDGGTLQARQTTTSFASTAIDEFLIGAAGGLIDSKGFSITIPKDITPDGGSTGGLTKAGSGTLTLSGTNTYSGATTVGSGILELGSATALGSSSAVSVANNATLRLATDSGSGRTVTINGSGASFYGALQGTASTTVSWAGDVVLGSNEARIGGGDGGTLEVDGVISDGGNGYSSIFSRAPNSTTVLNSVNTYTGDTMFFPNSSIVTLRMGVANAINSASRVRFSTTVGGTANFDLNGFDQNVRALIDTQAATLVVTNGGSADAVLTLSESNAANSATFDGVIQNGLTNTVALVKTGAGTQVLSGANTYTGTTTVSGGTLLVNGSLAATTVSIGSGATLGGSGAIGGPASILAGGILSPGTSPGTLAINNTLALDGGSLLAFEIDAGDPSSSVLNDLITGVTDLTLGGTLNLTGTGDFTTVTQGTTWRLINYTGSLTDNTLAIGTAPTLAAGLSFAVDTSTANEVNLVVVPEPGLPALLGTGLVTTFLLRSRRRETRPHRRATGRLRGRAGGRQALLPFEWWCGLHREREIVG
jgi:fibronectin-binding autotransporter adhesin